MRKLLLATSALLGASVGIAGVANAGTLSPNAPNPAPGSITVTLNALVEAFGIAGTDSGNSTGGVKRADYAIASYARLYPSFDGVLSNGLKYGGSIEIRQNSGANTQGINTLSTGFGQPATLFIQREFIYIGADKFGKIALGTPVQPSELFQTGNEVGFNTGGWDGDVNGFFTGTTGLRYMIDDDNDRAEKVVYTSPQFAGVDFGVSFEPNNNSNNEFGSQSGRVTSASFDTEGAGLGRRRDTIDGSIRYQAAFGPIGFKTNAAASYGATIRTNSPALDGTTRNNRNFTLYGGGAAVTYAGFELGGHIDSGVYGDDLSNIPRGSTGTTAYIAGGQYTVGPFVMGANYYAYDSGEFKGLAGNRGGLHAYGVAAGGTYTLAPGASIFLEYLFGQQHASGTDMTNETASSAHNHVRAQAFGIGSAFKW